MILICLQVIHCRGYLKIKKHNVGGDLPGSFESGYANVGFVGVANSLPPSSITEVKMHSTVFMFRASLDMKLIFLDQQVRKIFIYKKKSRAFFHFVSGAPRFREFFCNFWGGFFCFMRTLLPYVTFLIYDVEPIFYIFGIHSL